MLPNSCKEADVRLESKSADSPSCTASIQEQLVSTSLILFYCISFLFSVSKKLDSGFRKQSNPSFSTSAS